ncbi:MAG: hypothetical protein WCB46_04375 [Methanoregula sp.]
MTPDAAPPGNHPATNRSLKRTRQDGRHAKKRSSRKKTRTAAPATRPGCILIDGPGSCPEWEELLVQYPMIDSVQREDFPDYGASFAYLAHFYRTDNTAEEGSRARKEFENFFRAIGYEYDSSGNYKSRWFEGIGVHIRDGPGH